MFNLQGSEIIFILLIALVVLGPEKLPGAIRKATQTYTELRKMGQGFQSEFKSALDEPLREMRETADMIKESADPKKIAEDAQRESAATLDAERGAEHDLDDAADESIEDHRSQAEEPVSGWMGDADELGSSSDSASTGSHEMAAAGDVDEWADPIDPDDVVDEHDEDDDDGVVDVEPPASQPFAPPTSTDLNGSDADAPDDPDFEPPVADERVDDTAMTVSDDDPTVRSERVERPVDGGADDGSHDDRSRDDGGFGDGDPDYEEASA